MERITCEELAELPKRGAVQRVEALPVDAYAAEHIPGARNVPGQVTAELAEQVASERAATVTAYYAGPYRNRSTIAAAAFARLGHADVRIYAAGTQDRAETGLQMGSGRAGTVSAGRPV